MAAPLGNDCETADAEQAYAQSLLTGTETWVCLPPEARVGSVWNTPEVQKMKRPVVRLRLALYGHPDSGTYWERHCDAHLRSVGFEPISEVWNSCYWHAELKLYLVVYVDDFKLSGPKKDSTKGWGAHPQRIGDGGTYFRRGLPWVQTHLGIDNDG